MTRMIDRAELVAELDQAKEGTRELDCEIHNSLTGRRCFVSGVFIKDTDGIGHLWDASDLVPHYTTSLDAKLPGETIIRVKMIAITTGNPWGWEAVHSQDGLANNSKYFVGRGHTEALARRIAALKARGAS